MDRSDISSWLSGPKEHLSKSGVDFGYPGERLGLPDRGQGSIASFGRRLLALFIDWFVSILFVPVVDSAARYGSGKYGLLTLVVFASETIFFTVLLGGSFGQRTLRIRISRIDGSRPGIGAIILRTLLMCLVIPPAIWDRDGRGLHDKATATAALRG